MLLILLEQIQYGAGYYPSWSTMPSATTYIAPLYINSKQYNTPTKVTETRELGEINASATITGYYWIAY